MIDLEKANEFWEDALDRVKTVAYVMGIEINLPTNNCEFIQIMFDYGDYEPSDEEITEALLEIGVLTETGIIKNLYSYLKKTQANHIVVRTTYVKGCWYDNEFDAHHAGFNIYKFNDKRLEALHKFSECYELVRKGYNSRLG